MKAYSDDLRERVIQAATCGAYTQAEVAEQYAVSLSFVEKLTRRWRTTGEIGPKAYKPGRRRVLEPYGTWIRERIAEQPDITLEELCTKLVEAQGPRTYPNMMCREIQRLRIPLKKSRSTTASATRRG